MKKIDRYEADNNLPNEKAIKVSESDLNKQEQYIEEQQKKIDELEQQISKLKEENGRLTKALVFIARCTSVYGDDSIVAKKALETGGNK